MAIYTSGSAQGRYLVVVPLVVEAVERIIHCSQSKREAGERGGRTSKFSSRAARNPRGRVPTGGPFSPEFPRSVG